MNLILAKIKKQIEQSAKIKIYRDSIPHGTDLLRDLSRRFRPADFKVVFDIGANIGQTALEFSERFPNANIYSFEPVPSTFALLQKNTSRIKKFASFNLAFSYEEGELPMAISDDCRLNALVSRKSLKPPNQQYEIVKVSTLDRFVENQGIRSIDLLKIDTEGHDLNVLKGAERLLVGGHVNFIQVETGFGDSIDHVHLSEFTNFLNKRGYALFGLYEQQPYWTGEPWLMYANAVFIRKALNKAYAATTEHKQICLE